MSVFPSKLATPFWWPGLHAMMGIGGTISAGQLSGRVFLCPVWLPRRCTISQISCSFVVLGGDTWRVGLYSDNGFTPQGGILLADSGDVSGSSGATGGHNAKLTAPLKVGPGIVWVAIIFETAFVGFWKPTPLSGGATVSAMFTDTGSEMMAGCYFDQGPTAFGLASSYGPLPPVVPAVTANAFLNPVPWVRIESIYD